MSRICGSHLNLTPSRFGFVWLKFADIWTFGTPQALDLFPVTDIPITDQHHTYLLIPIRLERDGHCSKTLPHVHVFARPSWRWYISNLSFNIALSMFFLILGHHFVFITYCSMPLFNFYTQATSQAARFDTPMFSIQQWRKVTPNQICFMADDASVETPLVDELDRLPAQPWPTTGQLREVWVQSAQSNE